MRKGKNDGIPPAKLFFILAYKSPCLKQDSTMNAASDSRNGDARTPISLHPFCPPLLIFFFLCPETQKERRRMGIKKQREGEKVHIWST